MAAVLSNGNSFLNGGAAPRSQGDDGYHARGLKNLGNTCFMNAVLQALASCSGFVLHVSYYGQQKGGGSFTKCLSSCLTDLRTTNAHDSVINPKPLFDLLVKSNPEFGGHNEQDALELFDCMMHSLSRENTKVTTELRSQQFREQINLSHSLVPTPLKLNPKKARSTTPLANPFGGLLCSQIECQACSTAWGESSHRWTPVRHQVFTTLPLPVPTASSLLRQRAASAKSSSGAGSAGSGSSVGSAGSNHLATAGKLTVEACLSEFLLAESLSGVTCTSCSILSTIAAVQARGKMLLNMELKTPTPRSPGRASPESERKGLYGMERHLHLSRMVSPKDSYIHEDLDTLVIEAAGKGTEAATRKPGREGSDNLAASRSSSVSSAGSPTSAAEVDALAARSDDQTKGAGKGCELVAAAAKTAEVLREEVEVESVEDDEVVDEGVQRMQEMFLSLRQQIRTNAVKRSSVSRLPPLLCLYLCRRVYDERTGRMRKREEHVAFPLVLSMASSCSPDTRMQTVIQPVSLLSGSLLAGAMRGDNFGKYALRAVVEHQGNADSGHYVAYCLVDIQRRRWEMCSDASHSEVKEQTVLGKQATMLFYEKMAL